MMNKRQKRIIRHKRIRAKVSGTAVRPRLSVFKSNRHIHLQLIDDSLGKTLVAASTREAKDVLALARLLAEKASQAGLKEAVFDRGGYKYHGQIANIATAVRQAGLKI